MVGCLSRRTLRTDSMERSASLKKRKAVTRDVDDGPAVVSGDEFESGQLEGSSSASVDGVDSDDGRSESEDFHSEDLVGDEVPPYTEREDVSPEQGQVKQDSTGVDMVDNGVHSSGSE